MTRPGRRALTAAVAGVALLLLGAGILGVVRHEPDDARPPVGVQVLRVKSPEPDTPARQVWVWKPLVRNANRLPVLYFLHGVPGRASEAFDHGLADILSKHLRDEDARPFIVVSPDGNSPNREDTEWGDATDGRSLLETFLLQRVIPAVEGSSRRPRRDRAIAGFSMGGFGASNIGLRHPDLFGHVVSFAGYFHLDDPDKVFSSPADAAANSPDRRVAAARSVRLMLLDGDHDEEPAVRGELRRFAALLRQSKIEPVTVVAPGGHDWDWLNSQWPTVFDFLDRGWPSKSRLRRQAPRRRVS